ncbi:hypothetical protein GUITHDRAFT_138502 [Guillardia theta CCMP2712]|uniref:Hint domain-containing protein n=1 Tax=Guillardia theta (strain CCMP2712) TaxID=905079 RepID=L1JD35_GUITC|nr:hypothetical protein GUITHDRAFT_138502 [Guillardia theta CCMP2712]EKX46015.1 hypothetical protein GUITHDRAFT_138502 [Guillardia theta CCMP2712]|mmetsp:Transcript_44893/g.141346  ORF Transcript_44893/g.141346 Transcript_44893/m.141346 type:complete len:521 (-) Transcript_44893:53-1615(-)|eukprot:XP_005832995.1 hypothetical protein GUITHDRAFT_138502 [Guillardia theta CCMP2712]
MSRVSRFLPLVGFCAAITAFLCAWALLVQDKDLRQLPLLQGKEPKVAYLPRTLPVKGHWAYLPASRIAGMGEALQGSAPEKKQPVLGQWEYVPVTELKHEMHLKQRMISLANATGSSGGDGGNSTDEEDAAAAAADPFTGERTCAISSLVRQAKAIFPRWNKCGYILEDKGEADDPKYDFVKDGVISAPFNDTECTPDNIDKPPCSKLSIRTVLRGNAQSLIDCMMSIEGLSETCNTFDSCGTVAQDGIWMGQKSSVCGAPVGGYYKEPEVERMCGICEMFHATAGMFAITKGDPGEYHGCFSTSGRVRVERGGKVEEALLGDISVNDLIANGPGPKDFGRVYFIHDHVEDYRVVRLGTSEGEIELTPPHYLHVCKYPCRDKRSESMQLMQASGVETGDYLLGQDGLVQVRSISRDVSKVRYVLVENDMILLNGIVASIFSTAAGSLETLPFRFLDRLFPGLLQVKAVAIALHDVLESPILRRFESLLDILSSVKDLGQLPSPRLHVAAENYIAASSPVN